MATDWNKMTVNQLKAELVDRNLDTAGKKSDLVTRLNEFETDGTVNTDTQMSADVIEVKVEIKEELLNEEEPVEAVQADKNSPTEENMEAEDSNCDNSGKFDEEKMDQKEADEDVKPEAGDDEHGEQTVDVQHAEHEEQDAEHDDDDDDKANREEETNEDFYDYTKTATGFVMSVSNGQKIVVPSKEALKADILSYDNPRTVWVYPITISDVVSGMFTEYINLSLHFQITFHEDSVEDEKSKSGYIEFIFADENQASEQVELLSQLREGLTVRRLTLGEKRVDAMKELPVEASKQDQLLKRYLYIGNLPPSATSQALRALFPDAKRLAVMSNEEGLPKGYALAEMPSEESADRATKMYMNVEFENSTLVVMRAWFRIPKGLLDHETRVDLLKRVKRDRLKLRGRNIDNFIRRKLENEMATAKQRLDKDCKTRDDLGLPAPPDIVRRESMMKDQKAKSDTDSKDGDEKPKTTSNKSRRYANNAPYNRHGGRGNRRGVPSLLHGGNSGRYGGYGGQGYGNQGYYNESGYGQGQTTGEYNQAMQMLVQVSKMLGGPQTAYSAGPSSSSYGGNSNYRGGSSYGGSGYGYGGTKRPPPNEGFGGYNKRGPGNQRRW